MTRSEELKSLLSLEYLFYDKYCRDAAAGKLDPETAACKIASECRHIMHYKQLCREELQEEDYPEEYYFEDPVLEIPETSGETEPEQRGRWPEPVDCEQMTIWNYIQDTK